RINERDASAGSATTTAPSAPDPSVACVSAEAATTGTEATCCAMTPAGTAASPAAIANRLVFTHPSLFSSRSRSGGYRSSERRPQKRTATSFQNNFSIFSIKQNVYSFHANVTPYFRHDRRRRRRRRRFDRRSRAHRHAHDP